MEFFARWAFLPAILACGIGPLLMISCPAWAGWQDSLDVNQVLRRYTEAGQTTCSSEDTEYVCRTYLQQGLWSASRQLSSSASRPQRTLNRCTEAALVAGASAMRGFNFGKCGGSGQTLISAGDRPCVSPELKSVVSRSYSQVMTCFGLDFTDTFPFFAHESHFYPNAMSPLSHGSGGAGGPGQLTGIAIRDVNARLFDAPLFPSKKGDSVDFETYLQDRPGCSQVAEVKTHPMSPEFSKACDRISLTPSPVRNFVYSALIFLENRRAASRLISDWARSWKPKASAGTLRKMATELAWYMHNGGQGSVSAVFRNFALHHPRKTGLQQFNQGFRKALLEKYSPKSHRVEVANYVLGNGSGDSGIFPDTRRIEKRAGVRCSSF
jgi:hypothetical protein